MYSNFPVPIPLPSETSSPSTVASTETPLQPVRAPPLALHPLALHQLALPPLPQHQHQPQQAPQQHKFKATLCNQWLFFNRCRYGDRCRFAHGINDMNFRH